MDWKRFDGFRRSAGPVELDLIEAYASNKIGRRDFMRRGTIVGLSAPFMAGIIAACGSDDGSSESGSAEGEESTETGGGTESSGATGGDLIIAVQEGDANTGLDPINMLDLGTYSLVSQSFEYLVGLGSDGNIDATALATSWSPNDDGSVWTFELRPGVTWVSGAELTSADVAATMDRLAAQGNAGLGGVIEEGSVDASDPTRACLLYTSPSPRDATLSRMPSSA